MRTDNRAPARPLRAGLVTPLRLLAEGLRAVCAAQPDVVLVVDADSPAPLARWSGDLDVWLIDAALGRTAVRSLLIDGHFHEAPAFIINVAADDVAQIVDFVEAGARGYATAAEPFAAVLDALRALLRSETVCSPRVMASIFRRVAERARRLDRQSDSIALTPRQSEVVLLIARGLTDKQIADALRIRVSTVKVHVHHLLEKFNVRRRRDVVRCATRCGLLRPATSGGSREADYGV